MLEAIAEYLGVTVVFEEPLVGQLGEYQASTHVIRLHPQLSGLLLTVVLAHELGHAAHGHTTSTTVTEREADEFAHWCLIPFCYYLQATRAHPTIQGVAYELGVLPNMVEQYARRVCHETRTPLRREVSHAGQGSPRGEPT